MMHWRNCSFALSKQCDIFPLQRATFTTLPYSVAVTWPASTWPQSTWTSTSNIPAHCPTYVDTCSSSSIIRKSWVLSDCRANSRLAPSQWETSLRSNAISHWLGANLESALQFSLIITWSDFSQIILFHTTPEARLLWWGIEWCLWVHTLGFHWGIHN